MGFIVYQQLGEGGGRDDKETGERNSLKCVETQEIAVCWKLLRGPGEIRHDIPKGGGRALPF